MLLVFVFGFCQAHAIQPFRVVIDPGHGGPDDGARLADIKESDVTLKVSQFIASELRKDKRFSVTMTRYSDSYISLEDRASIANKNGDLFLSIHANSSSDPKARGQEIYFQNQLPPDEESMFLASRENKNVKAVRPVVASVSLALKDKKNIKPEVRSIVEDLERNHHLKLSARFAERLYEKWNGDAIHRRRSIRQAPFFVVSNVDKPAVLIEIGYLTNPIEAKKLSDTNYLKQIASGIYEGIVAFKNDLDTQPSIGSEALN